MNSIKGLIYGIVTSVTFGLIPLFTLPLMKQGMSLDSILFYRFLFATIALGIMMKVRKQSFAIEWKDLPLIILLSAYYMISAQFLFWGYEFMGAGVATTLHFTYPVFVTLLMLILFREKASWLTWLAIVLAIGGVARLSIAETDQQVSFLGVGIVLLSALGYAAYITTVNKSHLRTMPNRKLAFYVFVFTTLLFVGKLSVTHTLQPIPDLTSGINLVMLAVLPTVISNITLLLAVHNIGGTLTSVLGALEPVTAVCIGVFAFGEAFSWVQGVGIGMILIAVTLIILSKPIQNTLSSVVKMIRPRHS